MNLSRILFVLVSICFLSFNVKADFSKSEANQLFEQANDLYESQSYDSAIYWYTKVLNEGFLDDNIYFNLGNAYYRINEFGKGIWNYEKALKLNPNNEDAIKNLAVANKKVVDKRENTESVSFSKWLSQLAGMSSINFWSYTTILLWLIGFALLALFLLSQKRSTKKLGFLFGIIFLVVATISFVISSVQHGYYSEKSEGIILVPTASIKTSPINQSADAYTLHEGTKVKIISIQDEWANISFDSKNGWIQLVDLGTI